MTAEKNEFEFDFNNILKWITSNIWLLDEEVGKDIVDFLNHNSKHIK